MSAALSADRADMAGKDARLATARLLPVAAAAAEVPAAAPPAPAVVSATRCGSGFLVPRNDERALGFMARDGTEANDNKLCLVGAGACQTPHHTTLCP